MDRFTFIICTKKISPIEFIEKLYTTPYVPLSVYVCVFFSVLGVFQVCVCNVCVVVWCEFSSQTRENALYKVEQYIRM